MNDPAQRWHAGPDLGEHLRHRGFVADIDGKYSYACAGLLQFGDSLLSLWGFGAAAAGQGQVSRAALNQPFGGGKPEAGESTGDEIGGVGSNRIAFLPQRNNI